MNTRASAKTVVHRKRAALEESFSVGEDLLASNPISHWKGPPRWIEFLEIPLKDWLAYGYAAAYPLFMIAVFFSRDSIPFWIVVCISCVVILESAFNQGKLWVDASLWPLAALLALYGLSTLHLALSDSNLHWLGRSQVDRAIAVDFRLLNVVAAYFAFVNLLAGAPRRVLMNILRVQLWGGALVAVYGIVQFASYVSLGSSIFPIIEPTNEAYTLRSSLFLLGRKTVFRATSIFSEPAYFAFFLVPLVAKISVVWLEKLPVLGKRHLVVVSATLFVALACNFSMTGIVTTVLVFLLIWGTSVGRSGALIRISVLAVFAGGLLMLFTPLGSMVAERVTQIFALSDRSTLDRLFRAATGLMVFLEHPVFGLGPGGYAFLYPRLGGIQFNIMATPLNVWLSFLTDVGIPGFICLCWFLWGLGRRSFRLIRTDALVAVYFWSSVSYLVLLTSSDNWFTEMFWFELAMLLVTSQSVSALRIERR